MKPQTLYSVLKHIFLERLGREQDGDAIWEIFLECGEIDPLKANGFKLIKRAGGPNTENAPVHSIIKMDEKYYAIHYAYYSHEGFNYDGAEAYKVFPSEKTITIYE